MEDAAMDTETTQPALEGGTSTLSGMTITAKSDGHISATLTIGANDVADGMVDPAVILCMASRLARYGASRALGDGQSSTTIDCKTSFLVPCRTDMLTLDAKLIHASDKTSVWRAVVFDGQRRPVCELTQTEIPEDRRPTVAPADVAPDAAIELVRNGRAKRTNGKDTATERREQIVRGACEVIGKKGYAGASVRDIAAAAGMPVPTMYQYVQSKEDILALIYTALLDDIQGQLEEGLTSGRTASEKLDLVLRSNLLSLNKYRREVLLMFQESKNLLPQARAKVFEADRSHTTMWEQILREGRRSGEFNVEDVALTANFIRFLCTVWPLRHWAIGQHGFDAVLKDLRAFVFRALSGKLPVSSGKPAAKRRGTVQR
jgi:AcrR family transcriptional regulator/acyl-coenzyme A thioesterase PaaI-like protein